MDQQHMIRVRLKFESTPVSYAQKCWFTFDGEKCRLVSDVSHLLAAHFGIKNAHGIQVYIQVRIFVHVACVYMYTLILHCEDKWSEPFIQYTAACMPCYKRFSTITNHY